MVCTEKNRARSKYQRRIIGGECVAYAFIEVILKTLMREN
jgi:hypothetical protein